MEQLVFLGLTQEKLLKMALLIVRLWLESNHSSIDYFSVPKYHLINIFLKENSNIYCVVDVKGYEISNELSQHLSEIQIYPNFAQNEESQSITEKDPKQLVEKYMSIRTKYLREPNILLGPIDCGEYVCFLNSAIQVFNFVLVLRDYIINHNHLSKE